MPTNYQARVKMSPKTQASQVVRDGSIRPGLTTDALVKHPNSTPGSSAQKLREYPSLESRGPVGRSRPSVSRPVGPSYTALKRLVDIVGGTVLLAVAVPIVFVAAVAIRVDTPGSPFFFQTRLGKNGKPFKIFKLRGMYIDARTRFPTYYDYSEKRDLEFCFHHEEDPRVTRAGNFIRKTSIDELPNLWNVVLGDMSLVGPRPEIPEVLALYGGYHDEYLSVKPGITCLSKCTGRDRLTKRETIEFDIEYIRRRSFKRDLSILWRTFRGVMLRRDVF